MWFVVCVHCIRKRRRGRQLLTHNFVAWDVCGEWETNGGFQSIIQYLNIINGSYNFSWCGDSYMLATYFTCWRSLLSHTIEYYICACACMTHTLRTHKSHYDPEFPSGICADFAISLINTSHLHSVFFSPLYYFVIKFTICMHWANEYTNKNNWDTWKSTRK